MRREYPEAPLVGVGVLIHDEQANRIVLVERGAPPAEGKLSLPGGLVELGETVRAAAAREALEETGLEVEVLELIDVVDTIVYRPGESKPIYHYVLIDFLAKPVGGSLRAGGDAREAMWVRLEDIPKLAGRVTKSTRRILAKVGFLKLKSPGS